MSAVPVQGGASPMGRVRVDAPMNVVADRAHVGVPMNVVTDRVRVGVLTNVAADQAHVGALMSAAPAGAVLAARQVVQAHHRVAPVDAVWVVQ